MTHDIETYKKALAEIWATTLTDNFARLDRDALLAQLAQRHKCSIADATKILNYCRTKKLVTAEHYNSNEFRYTLNATRKAE